MVIYLRNYNPLMIVCWPVLNSVYVYYNMLMSRGLHKGIYLSKNTLRDNFDLQGNNMNFIVITE